MKALHLLHRPPPQKPDKKVNVVYIQLKQIPDGLGLYIFNNDELPKSKKQHENQIYFKLFDIFAKNLGLDYIKVFGNYDNYGNNNKLNIFKKYGFEKYNNGEFEKKVDDTNPNYFIEINKNNINITEELEFGINIIPEPDSSSSKKSKTTTTTKPTKQKSQSLLSRFSFSRLFGKGGKKGGKKTKRKRTKPRKYA
jgi:hypothetical protein